MTPNFQNRLVGAIVLVSFGVIFLPDVFDGEKEHYQENLQVIPLQGEIDKTLLTAKINDPENLDGMELVKAPEVVAVDDDFDLPKATVTDIKTDNPLDSTKNKIKIEETDSAWIIRLGTFRNHKNARSLVKKLVSQGYPAKVMPRNLKDGELARVEIGPDISRTKIAAMQTKLEGITGLKGQVIRFNPVSL